MARAASRRIAKTVIALPEATFCAGTTVPEPSAAVSILTEVATTVDVAVTMLVYALFETPLVART